MWRRRKHEMRSRHRWGELMVFIQLYFLHAVHIIHKDAKAPLVLRFTPSTPNIHQARFRMLPPHPTPLPKSPRGVEHFAAELSNRAAAILARHTKKGKKEREKKKSLNKEHAKWNMGKYNKQLHWPAADGNPLSPESRNGSDVVPRCSRARIQVTDKIWQREATVRVLIGVPRG